MPTNVVRMSPPGAPPRIARAISPAQRPSRIHAMIPMSFLSVGSEP